VINMVETVRLSDPRYAREVRLQIEEIRESGLLGRSRGLPTLFDYLVQRSEQDHAPKETEIAIDVFHCDPGDDTERTGSRTYIHRLRRKLEEFYAKRGQDSGIRLALPLGEYRLVALVGANDDAAELETAPAPAVSAKPWSGKWRPIAIGMICALVGAAATYLALRSGLHLSATTTNAADPAGAVRATGLWQALLAAKKPTVVIEGDYYMYTELDDNHQVRRLVRDLSINSNEDLGNYVAVDPSMAKRFGATYLNYVPYSVSLSLFEIRPLLAQDIQLRVLSSSAMKAAGSQWGTSVPFYSNMLYVGFLDGMGVLQGPTFAASRFTVDQGFKRITDRQTGKVYVTGSQMQADAAPVRQLGFVSSFRGPQGNRILLICGTGDMALITLTKLLTRKEGVAPLEPLAANGGSFEALYEVDAAPTLITQARLLVSSRLDPSRIWSPERTPNAFN
jgi:hypothetical protein